MIGSNADMGLASLHHTEQRGEDAAYSSDLLTSVVLCGRHRMEVSEQLIRPVDEIYFHNKSVPWRLISAETPARSNFLFRKL